MKKILKTVLVLMMVLALSAPAFAQIGYDEPPMDISTDSYDNGAQVTVSLYEYEKASDGSYKPFNSEDGILANEDLRFSITVTLPKQEGVYCDLKNPCIFESVINNASYAPVFDAEGSSAGDTELKFEATSAEGVYAAKLEYSKKLIEEGGTFTYMFTTQALASSTVTVNATLNGGTKELPLCFAYDGRTYDIEGVENENFTIYMDNLFGMVISVDSESKVTGLQIFSAKYSNKFYDVVYTDGEVTFKNGDTVLKEGDSTYTDLYADYETVMGVLGFTEGEMAYVYTNALVNRFNTAFSITASCTFDEVGSVPPPYTSGSSVVWGFIVMAAAIAISAAFFMKKIRKA